MTWEILIAADAVFWHSNRVDSLTRCCGNRQRDVGPPELADLTKSQVIR
jgi:hypothetical protein